jgi:hypothetical protein
MVSQFFVEAETFFFSVEEGKSVIRLEEGDKLRGCVLGFTVYYLVCRCAEGGTTVSGDRGFCQILSGGFEGLDGPKRL